MEEGSGWRREQGKNWERSKHSDTLQLLLCPNSGPSMRSFPLCRRKEVEVGTPSSHHILVVNM